MALRATPPPCLSVAEEDTSPKSMKCRTERPFFFEVWSKKQVFQAFGGRFPPVRVHFLR